MSCLELNEIELFVGGRLAGDASHSVSAHLASCAACRALVTEVRDNLGVASRLRGVVAGPGRGGPESTSADTDTAGLGPSSVAAPERIGAYRIVRELGRGGMGVVYEARQENPRRAVALKVMNGAYAVQPHSERLFRREAQALARLKHPCIAAIHEAGRAPDGRSFFAMELVRGRSLTRYAREENPPLPRKLALFKQICDAIAYAHQRGVIHRDLKPSNILVAEEGFEGSRIQGFEGETARSSVPSNPQILKSSNPQPKILDFGLARIFDADDSAVATAFTEAGRIQGTWPYMSPEQARGDTQNLDVRSDVYSLGVVLYELLTGRLPYAIDRTNVLEAARTICETPPSAVMPALRGDLETILLKALEKDPARRYASAAAFGDDLERYLSNQPIAARPPTVAYQLRKLIARHKAPFAFAAAGLLLLIGFGAAMTVLYAEARAQRGAAETNLTRAQTAEADATQEAGRARREARTANEVKDFLVQVFKISDPSEARGNTLTAREVLDQGVGLLQGELADEPEVRATLLDTIGAVYHNIGLYAEAGPLLEEALGLRSALFGERHMAVAETLMHKANWLQVQGDFDGAEALSRRALETCRALRGPDHPAIAQLLDNLGAVNMERGRPAQAGPFFEEALAMRRRLLSGTGPTAQDAPEFRSLARGQAGPADVAMSLGHLAWFHKEKGERAAAEQCYQEALAMQRGLLGDVHPRTAETLHNLAMLYQAHGDYARAEPHLREALDVFRRLHGEEHREVAACLNSLAALLASKGDLAQAEEMAGRALQLRRALLGPEHSEVAVSLNGLGEILAARGRPAEAEPLYREALAVYRRVYPDGHLLTAAALSNLATLLQERRGFAEAEALFQEALELRRAKCGPEHPGVAMALGNLGYFYVVSGDLARAEPLLQESLEMGRRTLGAENPQRAAQLQNLAEIRFRKKDFAGAEPLLREAVALERQVFGDRHVNLVKRLHNLAHCLRMLDKPDEAEPLYREALAIARETLGNGHPDVAQVLSSLGALLNARDAPAEAAPLFAEALEIQRRTLPAGHARLTQTETALAGCLMKLQRYAEAEPLLLSAYSALKSTGGDTNKSTQAALKRLVELYEAWGRPERAEEFRAALADR